LVGAAHCPEILKEPRLALMGFGRMLGAHLRRGAHGEAKSSIDKFIPHIGIALKEMPTRSDKEEGKITTVLRDIRERRREKMV
jgi:DNA topoisomerase VI subunit B